MNNENKSRFRIKWADREVEYVGDGAKEAYDDLIEYVKNIPIQTVTPTPISTPQTQVTDQTNLSQSIIKESNELESLAQDSNIPIEQLGKLIEFRSFEKFAEPVPFLPSHPKENDALLIICYTFQVGLRKSLLEVSNIKKIMTQVNGYPLPGRAFGRILDDFRKKKLTITSQTRGRNKPFSLSTAGIEAARGLLLKFR